jgi:hypothetical protein
MSSIPSRWRAPVTGAVTGLVVAAGVVGPSALASGGSAAKPPTAAKAAAASGAGCPAQAATANGPKGASAGPGPAPFLAAVAQLVQSGTINDAQARVLDAGIRAGSIDSSQLVANGTLSSAQMQAFNDRLGAIKRSFAPAGEKTQVVRDRERKRAQG